MENKAIFCLLFVLICCSIVIYVFGYSIGSIDTTNSCKERLIRILCPKTNDYLTYKYKTFEEVSDVGKTKE